MQRIGLRRGLVHCLLLGACAVPVAGYAQQIEQGVAIVSEAIASRVDGFDYKPDSTSELDFRGTALSPRADGTARVRTGSDRTEISAKFTHLPAAGSFGPFTCYVLWVVTPEGRASNVGTVSLDGDKVVSHGAAAGLAREHDCHGYSLSVKSIKPFCCD